MSPFSAFVVFLLIWWVTLFTILPFGVRGQAEDGEIVRGSEPGAPVKTNIKKKFLITTVVAFVLWVCVCAIIILGVVSWDDLNLHVTSGT